MDQDLEFIRTEINDLAWHLRRRNGLLDRIDREIERGRWIHPETTEALRLVENAKELRELADKLLERRNKLVANMPNLQAAE